MHTNLHSTMFLLLHVVQLIAVMHSVIYLHSTMFLLLHECSDNLYKQLDIYIPLCFYYYT